MYNIGDKISFKLFSYERTACWDNPFGVTHLYKFKDFDHNVFVWKTDRIIKDNISEMSSAIVKGFEEYDGEHEIVLKYCKLA